MTGVPWAKFYPCDWMSDPCVRRCSIAAQGLWINMLCLMFQGEGYLRGNGAPYDEAELAKLVGISRRTLRRLTIELELNGVFSRDVSGIIYSRRILRDIAKSKTNQENGRKGGSPLLQASDNREVKPSRARLPSPEPELSGEARDNSAQTEVLSSGCNKIANGPWARDFVADDGQRRLAQQEVKIRNLYDPAEARQIIADSLGGNIRSRKGYLGSFIARAEAKLPPKPKNLTPEEIDVANLRAALAARAAKEATL